MFSLVNDDSNMFAFFEQSFTFHPNTTSVTCCKPDQSSITATCGNGVSCAGQCFAEGASLCPTQDCGDCYSFDAVGRKGVAAVTYPSSSLNYCVSPNTRYGCRTTKREALCCLHAACRQNKNDQWNARCRRWTSLSGERVVSILQDCN
jgi:hypothetical protein